VIYGYLQGWPLEDSARFACAAASLIIREPRGSGGIPNLVLARRMAGV